MNTKIRYVSGVEGPHIQIGDMRVAGPKAWGGGATIKEWDVSVKDIVNALNNIYYPPHQPLESLEEEIKFLLHNHQMWPGRDSGG